MRLTLSKANLSMYRAKTSVGTSYEIYLQDKKFFLHVGHSVKPDREMNFIEMWHFISNERDYNLSNRGLLMKNDARWQRLANLAMFDEVDRWDETGNAAREVDETLERLIREIEEKA